MSGSNLMYTNGNTNGVSKTDRVCIIGAGPSGMSALYQYAKLDAEDQPEVVCYEKQDTWGGMWNFTWMTGTDEFGEVCHGGMYKHLWSNAPKECFEWKDYTFKEHFGKAVPSFLPRAQMRNYMESLWTKKSNVELKSFIRFNHAVRYVKYNEEHDTFSVSVTDLKEGTIREETFSHVICAVGIFSAPNKPIIPGIEDFQGRIIHSHDFRDAREFKGQRVLVIGGSFSAEDISVQCLKFGAERVICCRHINPMELNWPKNIEERPGIKRVLSDSVVLEDDTVAKADAIILSTGYLYRFPFMEESLKLKSTTSFYPDGLYKGMLWIKGGNNKLFYIGVQNQLYSLPLFNVQAVSTWRFICESRKSLLNSRKEMKADIEKWLAKCTAIASKHDAVEFQSQYMDDLIGSTGMDKTITNAKDIFHSWLRARQVNIATFRDESYSSIYTGQKASKSTPWMQNFEENVGNVNYTNGHI